jgi:raffinose/stachyose/melibiose transport system permease protein
MQTRFSHRLISLVYILPILALSGGMLYYSIGFTAYLSFHEWNGLSSHMTYVGWDNYQDLFEDVAFRSSLLHNMLFFFITVGVQAVLGLLISVMLLQIRKGRNLLKAIFFIPVIMAPTVIASIFRIIMDANVGALNILLNRIHLDHLALVWLGDPKISLLSIAVVNIFEWTGFSMMIYYAALLAIPEEIYEAAKMDGSGFWRTLIQIIFPMLNGATSTLTVLGIIGSLKTFDLVVLLTNGGPGTSSEVLSTYLYKRSMTEFNFGMGSATGVIVLIIALLLSIVQIRVSNRNS